VAIAELLTRKLHCRRYNTVLRIVNFLPPLVVTLIIAWPYYIYVFINCKILLADEVSLSL